MRVHFEVEIADPTGDTKATIYECHDGKRVKDFMLCNVDNVTALVAKLNGMSEALRGTKKLAQILGNELESRYDDLCRRGIPPMV